MSICPVCGPLWGITCKTVLTARGQCRQCGGEFAPPTPPEPPPIVVGCWVSLYRDAVSAISEGRRGRVVAVGDDTAVVDFGFSKYPEIHTVLLSDLWRDDPAA